MSKNTDDPMTSGWIQTKVRAQRDNYLLETPIKIEITCFPTYPCQHYVTIGTKRNLMTGMRIYYYCIENNIPIPSHFKYIKEDEKKYNKEKE